MPPGCVRASRCKKTRIQSIVQGVLGFRLYTLTWVPVLFAFINGKSLGLARVEPNASPRHHQEATECCSLGAGSTGIPVESQNMKWKSCELSHRKAFSAAGVTCCTLCSSPSNSSTVFSCKVECVGQTANT